MTDVLDSRPYLDASQRAQELQLKAVAAATDCQRQLKELRLAVLNGATTGRPALDHAIAESKSSHGPIEPAHVDLALVDWLETQLKAFEGHDGEAFLIRRGRQSFAHGTKLLQAPREELHHICGRFKEGNRGWSARNGSLTLIAAACPAYVNEDGAYERSTHPEIVAGGNMRRTALNGGAGFVDGKGEMAYWIGDDAVRAQLAALGIKPEAIEDIMNPSATAAVSREADGPALTAT